MRNGQPLHASQNQGKTVLQGNLKEIKDSYPVNRVIIETNKDITDIIKKENLSIENVNNNKYIVLIEEEASAHKLLKELIKKDITLTKFEIMKPTLNDIFIEKVGK